MKRSLLMEALELPLNMRSFGVSENIGGHTLSARRYQQDNQVIYRVAIWDLKIIPEGYTRSMSLNVGEPNAKVLVDEVTAEIAADRYEEFHGKLTLGDALFGWLGGNTS